jgi:hypothetical protein
LTVRLLASNVALSMTPETVTLWPTSVVVPPAERSAPAMLTAPAVEPTPSDPPAVTFERRLVRLVSAVVLLFFFDLNALSADAASVAEVMLTPFVPVRTALPPATMSEPLTLSRLPAATLRLPPVARLVPLNVCVLLDEDALVFLPVRDDEAVVSVVVTPVMLTSRPAERLASPPALTLAAESVRSRPALTIRVPVAKKPPKSQEVDTESAVIARAVL